MSKRPASREQSPNPRKERWTAEQMQRDIASLKSELRATENKLQSTDIELGSTKRDLHSTRNDLHSTQSDLHSTKNRLQNVENDARPVIQRVMIPIILAILYKFVFKTFLGKDTDTEPVKTTIPDGIRAKKNQFRRVGFEDAKMMAEWAESYETVITARNFSAHETGGDDIVRFFDRMPPREQRIVERVFPKVFGGISIKDWRAKASPKQREKRIRNASDGQMEQIAREAEQVHLRPES